MSVASRSIICLSLRLRQIIDLRDTDKSRYFAITEFNNCFIIRSPSLFFNAYLREAKQSAFFHARTISRVVSFTYGQNIICSQTQLDDIAHEQAIICRQLFAGHVLGFQPMKRKKNLHRMVINFVHSLCFAKLKVMNKTLLIIFSKFLRNCEIFNDHKIPYKYL